MDTSGSEYVDEGRTELLDGVEEGRFELGICETRRLSTPGRVECGVDVGG